MATRGPPRATNEALYRRGKAAKAIVLAMHGLPPRDFPGGELAELFGLHARLGRSSVSDHPELAARYTELDARVRRWPRNGENDPFFAGSKALAESLAQGTGWPVFVGFNEFCAPDLDVALDQAAAAAGMVAVLTPMMTAGGEHSEIDIPAAIERARVRNPHVRFVYAWPFDVSDISRFLTRQLWRFVREHRPVASPPSRTPSRSG